jgi:copper transport protein
VRVRRIAAAIPALLAALLAIVLAPASAGAHAGLTASDPAAGADLGASPTVVRLTFSEQPEASLSQVRLLGADGSEIGAAPASVPADDPLTLELPVGRLAKGLYTVDYDVVSAVDGHATGGSYTFGVRTAPGPSAAAAESDATGVSALEVTARWMLIAGLVILLGALVAALAGFGGSPAPNLKLAGAGWLAATVGVLLLAEAQRRTTDSSLGDLLGTPVGSALLWRAGALAVAGASLLLARRRPRAATPALGLAAFASLVAVIAHVDAGHAAAGGFPRGLAVTLQVVHFAAVAVWFGGLAALLVGLRGESSAAKAASVRRFSAVALVALLLVLATGIARAVDELSSWGQLLDTGYGRAVLAKLALIGLIALVAARNRRRSVPASETGLGPLRRTSRVELVLAAAALAVAALLGTLAPPLSGPLGPAGLAASGSDYGTSVRVSLTAPSDQPGPNHFVAEVDDYDSGAPIADADVSLRFEPLDDPGIAPTTLPLRSRGEGTYAGSGGNLAFDGRWQATVTVQRGLESVEVPLTLELPIPDQFVSVAAPPGVPPEYTMQVDSGYIRLSADPGTAGDNKVKITVFTVFEAVARIEQIVLTAGPAGEPPRAWPLNRIGKGTFETELPLAEGTNELTVTARANDGVRLRGRFELDVPEG